MKTLYDISGYIFLGCAVLLLVGVVSNTDPSAPALAVMMSFIMKILSKLEDK